MDRERKVTTYLYIIRNMALPEMALKHVSDKLYMIQVGRG